MNILPPPGPERRNQLTLLGVVVAVLIAYFGYQYWPKTSGAATASNTADPASTKQGGNEKLPVPDKVKLDELTAAPANTQTARNPFRFGQPPAPTRVEAPIIQQGPPPPPPPPLPPPAPQVPLKLLQLGMVTATKQPLVNLLDPDTGTTFLVREGGTIDGKYKLLKVNANSVIVAFIDGTGQKSLFLER